ncbi:MAG: hypothetical protein M1812_001069 [Candelaria pacifica]|nr:MAG: hypothetical protein M1812_001069 [Candelaria pacifica]
MAGTRSSARQAAAASSSPNSSAKDTPAKAAAGSKRKTDDGSSPAASKRGKKGGKKEQKTLEETMPDQDEEAAQKDVEMKEAGNGSETQGLVEGAKAEEAPEPTKEKEVALQEREDAVKAREDALKDQDVVGKNEESSKKVEEPDSKMDSTGAVEPNDTKSTGEDTKAEETEGKAADTEGGAVETTSAREESTPSNVLEKGIIYFFYRGRVNVDEPQGVEDLARSYIVLRPLPHGAKLGYGAIEDAGNNRLLALPKKVLPKSNRDRFMVFVEKANTTTKDIKENFIAPSDYATQTAGTRHTPSATPAGEGIYAITTTGRESHLAYILTVPSELGEIQKEIGLRERGSFVTSLKNPKYAGPANTNLPAGPAYPQEILDEFRSLRWMPLQPKHLDYENSQVLIIGEGMDEIGKAAEQSSKDEKNNKDTPLEEMEKLEHEDDLRVQHLKADDPVFDDLGLDSKNYKSLETSW